MNNENDNEELNKKLIALIKERADDIEGLRIMVTNEIKIGPLIKDNFCAVVDMVNGESRPIHRDQVEALLNDGLMKSIDKPISLVAREAR